MVTLTPEIKEKIEREKAEKSFLASATRALKKKRKKREKSSFF
jgi:hypothetical protein